MSEFIQAYPMLAAMVVILGAWAVETASATRLRHERVRTRSQR